MKFGLSVIAAALCAQPLAACDLCSVYSATKAQGESGVGIFAGLAEQLTSFHTLQVNGDEVPNVGDQYLYSSISQFFAGYNFNNWIGLQLNLPVIYREYGYLGQHGSEWGIGDLSLIANARLYQKLSEDSTFRWTALGGAKFPTGDSAHLNPEEPEFAPGIGGHDLALGSGSYDALLGTGFFVRWKRLFLTGAMQYAIRTEGEFGYQFANDWIWFGGPGFYLLLDGRQTLSLQAVVSGESKGQDTVGGVALDDTAITAVYLGPELAFTWSNRLSAQLGADLPVSIVTTGQQIVPDFRVRAAITWRF